MINRLARFIFCLNEKKNRKSVTYVKSCISLFISDNKNLFTLRPLAQVCFEAEQTLAFFHGRKLKHQKAAAYMPFFSFAYGLFVIYLFIYLILFQEDQAVPCLKGTFQFRFLTRHKRTSPNTYKKPSITVASQYICSNKTITQSPIITEAVIQRVILETTIKTGLILFAREVFQSLTHTYQRGW